MKYEIDILLVEDNPFDVELTLRALNKNNISNKVIVLNDGEEALDFLFCRNKYADRIPGSRMKLILIDLKLPRISGMEVIKQIKSNDETKKYPVVVLTSSREEQDIIKSYDLGANSYIVKPVEFEQFKDCIKDLGLYWLILNEPPV